MATLIAAPHSTEAGSVTANRSARWALASLSLSMLMPSLDTSIANVGLPTLAQALGASFREVQWVVLAYLLSITTLIVSVGRLGDMIGRRRLLLIGIATFTAASVLCGAAPTLPTLIAARAIQGLGAAIMMALTVALAGEVVPAAKTGSSMGLLGTMSAIGTALGPSLGGILIAGFGWRVIFLINLPLGILNFFLARRHLNMDFDQRPKNHPQFDYAGTLLLVYTLAAYALAMTIGKGSFGRINEELLFAAVIGAGLFVAAEKRTASPLIRLAMLRDAGLAGNLATSTLVSTVMMATLVVGPFYLSKTLGLQAALVGLVMSAGPLVAALTGLPAGFIVDRFGASRVTVAGLLMISAGCFGLSMMQLAPGVAAYVGAIVIVTSGYALFQAANNTAIMIGIRAEQRGLVSGLLNLSRNLGLITGASAMGAIFAHAASAIDITMSQPKAVAAGMRVTFRIAAFLIAAASAVRLGGKAPSKR